MMLEKTFQWWAHVICGFPVSVGSIVFQYGGPFFSEYWVRRFWLYMQEQNVPIYYGFTKELERIHDDIVQHIGDQIVLRLQPIVAELDIDGYSRPTYPFRLTTDILSSWIIEIMSGGRENVEIFLQVGFDHPDFEQFKGFERNWAGQGIYAWYSTAQLSACNQRNNNNTWHHLLVQRRLSHRFIPFKSRDTYPSTQLERFKKDYYFVFGHRAWL